MDPRKQMLKDPAEMAKFIDDYARDNPEAFAEFSKEMEYNMKNCENREEEICKLPKEDTVWLIVEQPTEKLDGKEQRCLILLDKEKQYLAYHMEELTVKTFIKQCYSLVCLGCLYPLSGKSRRPRLVTFKDPEVARSNILDISKLKIRYINPDSADRVLPDPELEYVRECSSCRRRGSPSLFKECAACTGSVYCSKECQTRDWKRTDELKEHGHKKWCKLIKSYIAKTDELATFPFTFTKETTDKEFHQYRYKKFLEDRGVYNQGLWRRECPLSLSDTGPCIFGQLSSDDNPYILPSETAILSCKPDKSIPSIKEPLRDWQTYYDWRGFKLDSPIAILLHIPITLYHVVIFYFAQQYNDQWRQIESDEKMIIHILGVEKEVEMLMVFQEFGYLLPNIEFEIHMFGVELHDTVNNTNKNYGNISITIHKQLYHDYNGDKPHLAIGFNAGISAYLNWGDTIIKLKNENIPSYFTDYCQYSCECSRRALSSVSITAEPTLINPFRNPVRKICTENNMPWYSNGFIFKLNYTEEAER
ncbi:hypothetical protein LOTGIDRAFT_228004 [Lottia gigantea]|uniref:MYND-type domain-containing protein n=1 Tax=Lottia gigantea TaxID=225164 RepID=V4B4J9_LOTGI|nr:hypothetical protein LOTGIDRAFT_228004 [Lottia gigantea]ESP05403.1 hypothetical protein LOTGIDRAFT_228004 [Lottia gigantea]